MYIVYIRQYTYNWETGARFCSSFLPLRGRRMLATPRNAVTARDPEETQLNRTAAVLADVEEFEIAQIHEESANILSSIEGTIEPKHSKKFYKNVIGSL